MRERDTRHHHPPTITKDRECGGGLDEEEEEALDMVGWMEGTLLEFYWGTGGGGAMRRRKYSISILCVCCVCYHFCSPDAARTNQWSRNRPSIDYIDNTPPLYYRSSILFSLCSRIPSVAIGIRY